MDMFSRTTAALLCISLIKCRALSPTPILSPAVRTTTSSGEILSTRRSAAFAILNSAFAVPSLALAIDAVQSEAETEADAVAAKERMRQRIADSKNKYRKSSDLVKQRKDTTDYSCVAETGSPCPEGLVPRAVQREIVGVLEKSGIGN